MATMTIFTGNIGCGKSFMAKKLAKKGHAIVTMDSIQQMISGGEYNSYDAKKRKVYWDIEETAIKSSLDNNINVVIDRTCIDRARRKRFVDIGKTHADKIVSMNWGEGYQNGLDRRLKNPRGNTAETWKNVHDYMRKSYEAPTLEEGFDEIIEAPICFKFHAFDFDGTIVEHKFPKIGEIIQPTVNKMNSLWKKLSNVIIVWSCRNDDYENEMRIFLLLNKIPFDFINENPIVSMGRKIFAHEYFDDRNKFLKGINK